MNKVKSLFIAVYPMLAMGIGGYALYRYATGSQELIWLGAALATLPFMLFLMSILLLKHRARTSAHFPLFTGLAIAGLLLAGVVYLLDPSAENRLPLELAAVGAFAFFLYNFWYSKLGRGASAVLKRGRLLPIFSVENAAGERLSSENFIGKPTIYLFYRGNWCPLCMAQIKEIAGQYRHLEKLGVRVVLVSPQPHRKTKSLAEKFDVPFEFLVDVESAAAQRLGIFMQNGLPAGMELLGYDSDTVYPTVVVTDADGRILYADQTDNYRVRPEPSTFLAILRNHQALAAAA